VAAGDGGWSEGALLGGVPFLRLGSGPPLLAVRLVTADHRNPTGFERRMVLSGLDRFAEHFTVYVVNGPPGLPSGASMSDIARYYANAIEHDIGEPVFVHGVSTGGSVSLQLAIDHPALVRRMVLAGAACRFSPYGRRVSAEAALLTAEGDDRRAMAVAMEPMVPGLLKYPIRALAWVVGPMMAPDDPHDMLVVAEAEDRFDAEPDLGRVRAPTLVVGGSEDLYYSEDLIRRTADGIPAGRLALFPGKSHSFAISSKPALEAGLDFLLAEGAVASSATEPEAPAAPQRIRQTHPAQ
jgi:pimeloyl-ACP methyl ester carboxylesterase